jgi:hypothetical protein
VSLFWYGVKALLVNCKEKLSLTIASRCVSFARFDRAFVSSFVHNLRQERHMARDTSDMTVGHFVSLEITETEIYLLLWITENKVYLFLWITETKIYFLLWITETKISLLL